MTGVAGHVAGTDAAAADVDMALARETLARVRSGRSTFGRAAAVLGIPPERLGGDRDDRALAVYRAYVGRVVEVASPLALRACALSGLSLDALALLLRPGAGWKHWLCGPRPGEEWRARANGRPGGARPDAAQCEEWSLQAWLHGGAFVDASDGSMSALGVRVLDAGLEMAACLGGHLLRTRGGEGAIDLRLEIPATVAAALPGRPLDRLVGHPLLDGAGCVVTEVGEWQSRSGVEVRFALGPVPWRMPWARMADAGPAAPACGAANGVSVDRDGSGTAPGGADVVGRLS